MTVVHVHVTTDALVGIIERRLRAAGATFDDIDARIARELGVSLDAWCGYLAVISAGDRYQSQFACGTCQASWQSDEPQGDATRLTSPDTHPRTGR